MIECLLPYEQEYRPHGNGRHARPFGNIDGLLVFDFHFEGAKVHIVGFLGVGELAVNQPQDAGDDQDDSDNF